MEEARLQLKDQLLCLETEQESILGVIGKEIDAACKTFSRDSMEKLKVTMNSCTIIFTLVSRYIIIMDFNPSLHGGHVFIPSRKAQ